MNTVCQINKDLSTVNFAESECSDGMCCFTCVIPPNNGHIGFFKSLWKSGTGYPFVKLLITSEGYKDELYDSCKFLDFTISRDAPDSGLSMNLRCSIYKYRPRQCAEYPDRAGESLYHRISGPCIFNEYTAPAAYHKLIYKREWQAFYAIQDNRRAITNIFAQQDTATAREMLLKAKNVQRTTIALGKEESDYILISLPKRTQNILYSSEKHQPITTIKCAYHRWEEKIQKNLESHYGSEWETRLKTAIETEETDASKGIDENTCGNIKC